jgi:hypothetical protein
MKPTYGFIAQICLTDIKKITSMATIKNSLRAIMLFCLTLSLHGQENDVAFKVDALFDFGRPESLGLAYAGGQETVTIYSPGEGVNRYNNGVVLFPFRGMLYAQWQSSAADEDADDTRVYCSRSADGITWEEPVPLTDRCEQGIRTGGGWWSDGSTLVAYINVWPGINSGVKEGYTEYMTSADGVNWEPPEPVLDIDGIPVQGIIEQDVHALPGGRLVTAFHIQPGLRATPCFTDDPLGVSGWRTGEMKSMPMANKKMSRGIEPSWFLRGDGAIVMIFRDQGSSFRSLASVSRDDGMTWSCPVVTDMPDSRAKQSAGNLPDGTAFIVNNPSGCSERFPLVITVSRDGFLFDKAYLLRSGGDDLQLQRFAGKYKTKGYNYPKSIVWGGWLYVSYATNKEDVELTRIPLDSLLY